MEEKNDSVELDEVSAERMQKMGIDVSAATHEQLMRYTAVAQAYYLSKIRFWITFWSVLILLVAGLVFLLNLL